MDQKELVRAQFGRSAAAYASSDVHARGDSLAILVDLVQPEPTWSALDVATGAGHTALAFAPHVASVIATDLTPEMLGQTGRLAAERGLANLETRPGDAERLPFPDASFDALTCCSGVHWFDQEAFFGELHRVLRPGAWVGLYDHYFTGEMRAHSEDMSGAFHRTDPETPRLQRHPTQGWTYKVIEVMAGDHGGCPRGAEVSVAVIDDVQNGSYTTFAAVPSGDPAKVKAFYMEPDPQRPELALCVDVLAPEGYGEIIGGSQRMASHELLVQRIHEHGLPEEAFKWYLDLRKYGSVPHGGFGMGIERAVAWICGLEHVRETIPFPRMLHRLYP